jgi:hypothetical protein
MSFYDPEEWLAAEEAVKDVLALAYANGEIDVKEPVDGTLRKIANAATKAAIRTANHYVGSDKYYSDPSSTNVGS